MTAISPRNGTFDLHLHSNRSDGRFEPEEVLEHAARGGIDVIALTDHDMTCALDPKVHQVGSRQIRVVSGAEISGQHDGREFHLLVYFPGDPPTGFRDFCASQIHARAERYDQAVENIGLPGLPDLSAQAARGELAITRLHLARSLVEAGHATDVPDAFSRYARHPTVPRLAVPFVECIRVARSFGGLTSWAHPPRIAVNRYLEAFVDAGLQGLEGLRPGLVRTDRNLYRKAARRHGLYLTGGSDWHGWTTQPLGLFQLRGQSIAAFLDALERAA
jgi:predicted metal-dependent phosphoesterase TrpH